MAASTPGFDEKRSWISAFVILLLVSIWMLSMRITNSAFLMFDFEVTIVYLPTALAAIVAAYVSFKGSN